MTKSKKSGKPKRAGRGRRRGARKPDVMSLRTAANFSQPLRTARYTVSDRKLPASVSRAGMHREVGRDLLGSAMCTGTTYSLIFAGQVSTDNMGLRVQQMAKLYEKYSVNSLRFTVDLSGPINTAAGSFVQVFGTDPSDLDPPLNLIGHEMLCAHRHQQHFSFLDGKSHSMDVRIMQPECGYYTDASTEPRTHFCGKYWLMAPNASSTTFVQIFIDYDVTFWEPSLEFTGQEAGGTTLYSTIQVPAAADPGYLWNYVTPVLRDSQIHELLVARSYASFARAGTSAIRPMIRLGKGLYDLTAITTYTGLICATTGILTRFTLSPDSTPDVSYTPRENSGNRTVSGSGYYVCTIHVPTEVSYANIYPEIQGVSDVLSLASMLVRLAITIDY